MIPQTGRIHGVFSKVQFNRVFPDVDRSFEIVPSFSGKVDEGLGIHDPSIAGCLGALIVSQLYEVPRKQLILSFISLVLS